MLPIYSHRKIKDEEGPLIGTAFNCTVRLIRVVLGPSRTSTLVRMKLCLMRLTATVPLTGLDFGIEGLPGAMIVYDRRCCLAGLSSLLLGNFGYKAV
jgi:hypothetical protein